MSNQTNQTLDTPRVLGMLFALLGSLVVLGVTIFISHDATYLWSIILIAIVAERIRITETEYYWKPTVLGAVMGLLCLCLAAVIYYVNQPGYIWALLLIGFLTDSII